MIRESTVARKICSLLQQGYNADEIQRDLGGNRSYIDRVCRIYKRAKPDSVILEVHEMCQQILAELREIRHQLPQRRKRELEPVDPVYPGDSEADLVRSPVGHEETVLEVHKQA